MIVVLWMIPPTNHPPWKKKKSAHNTWSPVSYKRAHVKDPTAAINVVLVYFVKLLWLFDSWTEQRGFLAASYVRKSCPNFPWADNKLNTTTCTKKRQQQQQQQERKGRTINKYKTTKTYRKYSKSDFNACILVAIYRWIRRSTQSWFLRSGGRRVGWGWGSEGQVVCGRGRRRLWAFLTKLLHCHRQNKDRLNRCLRPCNEQTVRAQKDNAKSEKVQEPLPLLFENLVLHTKLAAPSWPQSALLRPLLRVRSAFNDIIVVDVSKISLWSRRVDALMHCMGIS